MGVFLGKCGCLAPLRRVFSGKKSFWPPIELGKSGKKRFVDGGIFRHSGGTLLRTPNILCYMPTYTPANSDAARLSNLETALSTSKLDHAEAKLLPASLQTQVENFLPIYRPVVQAVDAAMAGRAKEVSEKDQAKENLKTHVQDFFEVLKRRTNRMKHDVSVLVYYGITQGGDLPAMGKESELESVAEAIEASEETAVEAGFPAMSCPTAAEVATALAAYAKESQEVVPAATAVRQAEQAAALLRKQADDLLDDVKHELSHALRKEPGPSQRRVLRLFGFKYAPNPGETAEPEPTPSVPPAV